MRGFVWRLALNAAALLLAAQFLEGIEIRFTAAFLAAPLWGFVNAGIRPVINVLRLSVSLLTVGLFTLVVNSLLLWYISHVIQPFTVASIGWGALGVIILSLVSSVFSALIEDK